MVDGVGNVVNGRVGSAPCECRDRSPVGQNFHIIWCNIQINGPTFSWPGERNSLAPM